MHDSVFLLDVDNTLLDNDSVIADLDEHLLRKVGDQDRDRYWQIYETLRAQLGYADYLGALQRYRVDVGNDPCLPSISAFLLDYPFAERLYPGALDVISHLGRCGPTVILTDGDVVLQPRKVQRSGLWHAAGGRVLIYLHKEQMLDEVAQRYPARHYTMVDDKLRILTAVKTIWDDRVTTVFPRQGHYAREVSTGAACPPADISIGSIRELLDYDLPALLSQQQNR